MKKVVKRICNTLMAFAVATSMLSFVGTQASAAEESIDTVKESIDTVVIDFSKEKVQVFKGTQPSSEDLDKGETMSQLSQEAKNIAFISVLNYYNELFGKNTIFTVNPEWKDGKVVRAAGNIIIDKEAGQTIHFEMDENKTIFDVGSSTGVYERRITRELLDQTTPQGKDHASDVLMPFYGAEAMFGIDAGINSGKYCFNLKIDFGKAEEKPADEEETPAPTPVKEEEKTTKEETTTPSTEKKEDQQKTTETEQKAPETEKKAETVETVALDTEFEEDGYSYKVTADGEVSFVTVTDKKVKSVNIPDSVTHQNVEYKVTSVADKALYNCSKLKSVTVGANVKTIGASAFAKSKKLKTVTIKSASLTSIGKKAFSKNDKKIVVKVYKANYKKYKKLMKKSGMSSVKLKKIGK
ncbi:leucine-rich repeat protein [Butyrivibrio sp. INlla16]|uniref:leucine-rich repeat protein n=1 Tax=Butyrivibrio sp. INlla16 TaxID=1520807 RepID=UPI0008845525|nr:leucine-rich repeat domain-containing protein [Butyrivibrio sp. INlla16]SDB22539.1 Leucine rich repeat-containing protein [Butyrivibrio sp. INlla16]